MSATVSITSNKQPEGEPETVDELQSALYTVKAAIASVDRQVTLIAVTKYASLQQMVAAYTLGLRDFGENKVQDALAKKQDLPQEIQQTVNWHLIGHLQSNKVTKTVGQFVMIHSVDSLRLAQKLSEVNLQAGCIQKVLLQINISGETSKEGFSPEEITECLEQLTLLEGIQIKGLMTIAPNMASDPILNATFQGLGTLRNALEAQYSFALPELSMGMSGDYGPALRLGATIIRIGSQFFGKQASGIPKVLGV